MGKKLFVVGKVPDLENYKVWEFEGIYDNEEVAKSHCVDEHYFIGPCELNTPLPEEPEDWPGGYYPVERT